MGMFLLGALTVGASIAKVVIFHQIDVATTAGTADLKWVESPAIYWSMVESSLGIVGACLPLLRPLVSNTTTSGFMRSMRSVTFVGSDNGSSMKLEETPAGSAASTPNSIAMAKFEAMKGFRSDVSAIGHQKDSL